jgi:hypothetical protein
MSSIRGGIRKHPRVRIGVADPSLTAVSGMVAITELVDRLEMIKLLDEAVGPIKERDRGFGVGELLVGLASAQLAGEDFLVGLDRQRDDVAGQEISPVAGLSSTTAAGLARRFTDPQWTALETGVARVTERALKFLPVKRRARLADTVTIDLDTTDVEVFGPKKRGVAYNHQGQRCGRPHVAAWAEMKTVLAAKLFSGNDDARASAPDVLLRALKSLPQDVRHGQVRLRADTGYFDGKLARVAFMEGIEFAIGAKRIAPLWNLLSGLSNKDWNNAIDMEGAQVAVASYRPAWWPSKTEILIRRVKLDISQVSTDSRSRRRRTLHPDQRALPLEGLAEADEIYAYSFVCTNIDVSTPDKAVAVEHWYRQRTTVENIFRDSKHGAALRHLPSGYEEINTAWMWGALLAANIAAWLHELTATATATATEGKGKGKGKETLIGHGIRGGKAMITTLRHRLIRVPGRLVHHAGRLTLRLPPGRELLAEILARLRKLPAKP